MIIVCTTFPSNHIKMEYILKSHASIMFCVRTMIMSNVSNLLTFKHTRMNTCHINYSNAILYHMVISYSLNVHETIEKVNIDIHLKIRHILMIVWSLFRRVLKGWIFGLHDFRRQSNQNIQTNWEISTYYFGWVLKLITCFFYWLFMW